jgi:DNA-binding NarL/FixJ family response regulator
MSEKTAVLLDEAPLWLDAVEHVLTRNEITIVGKTTSPEMALRLIDECRPKVLMTEIRFTRSEMDGIACIQRALERSPELKVVVVSMHEDADHIDAAFEAGAAAYVVKSAHPDDLASTIRQAFHHSMYLSRARGVQPAPAPAGRDSGETGGLTRRELEILQLVAEGHSNSQLARMLWVTEQTVKFHLSNVYRKLDVANRTEASRWAQLNGLLEASSKAPAAA